MKSLSTSVVICTYNRPRDLAETLESIAHQSRAPLEIVVIDNSRDGSAEPVVAECASRLEQLRGVLRHERRQGENSLTAARNQGVRSTKGDLILFLDDDVTVDPAFLEEVTGVLESDPVVLGVQGYMQPAGVRGFTNFVFRFFREFHYAEEALVLPSVSATYPLQLAAPSRCEWLSGTNQCYRRKIFDFEVFDEQLVRYSEGEDLDFSYRVHRRFPGSLRITPAARLVHRTSTHGRMDSYPLILMREVYGLYLFHKLFQRSAINVLSYLWSRIGKVLLAFGRAAAALDPRKLREVAFLISAYAVVLARRDEIRSGSLERINRLFVQEESDA